jgi:sulfoacetaldehyde dehydrogenase
MFPEGKLSSRVTAKSAAEIARIAGLQSPAAQTAKFLIVHETSEGPDHPFSGEKLCPVLTVWQAADFQQAIERVARIYAYQGAGHSVGLHTAASGPILESRAALMAERLPVARVIINQAHAIATGGSFDNGLPFSLSMGCGTWGKNSFSENLHYRHFMNTTRIVRPITQKVPSVESLLDNYFEKFGH